ncbi:rhamnulokinase family protein [Phycisphaerales bacterium AB-hyl4]|uniref:Rhamnulokinase family protein n=1 Tax=Natronomicrosphaera hydrolytica TaxID=3242702 RepID=A0ABV4U2Q6_9BACT
MSKTGYVAFDLGAESGRAMLAVLDGEHISLTEAHRFANTPQRLPSGYHWNLLQLWADLMQGLTRAGELAREQNVTLVSLGVDTWGVDFGLIGKSGQLLGLPYAYRDERHPLAFQQAIDKLGEKTIYDATGIQFLPFNTLFQLIAQRDAEPATLEHATRLLNMPDLLHYFFSGQQVNEATIASTTQMVDPHTGKWSTDLLQRLDLPTHMLGRIVPAGSCIGKLRAELAEAANVEPIDVIVPGSHDTASAVAAVPVDVSATPNWAYLSSGTWSLMGAEVDEPIVTDASREAGFTNERGVGNKIRLLKNIAGLWLVQQVRADYARRGEEYDYPALTQQADAADPFRTLIDPGHAPFATPGDMCAKIDAFADATGQPRPETPGQYVRCCLESLAMTYRHTLAKLEDLLGQRMDVLHIVGGGGKNALLNQMTADAIDRRVVVGPYEGTAVGNALTQAIGHGDVRDLAHLRTIVRNASELLTVEPGNADSFNRQAHRFADLLGK